MTRARSLFEVLLLVGLALVVVATATPAIAAERPRTASAATTGVTRTTATEQKQHVRVSWKGSQKKAPVYSDDATIPGIGDLQLICRPKQTMIKLYTPDRGYETQMWLQKYEVKNNHDVVAVKTPRIYRYATAADDGTGGTGSYANEGLNQQPGVENYASGYLNGLISQRSSRSAAGPQLSSPKPVTSFELTWYWNGFDHPQQYRSCTIDAVFDTKLTAPISVTWHGDADAVGHDTSSTTLPGVGRLDVACSPGTGTDKTLTVTPGTGGTARVYVETVTGEGWVEDHVVKQTVTAPTPVTLPQNGTLRIKVTSGAGVVRWLLVSSYYVVNNRLHPELDLCEVAAAVYQATFD